MFRKPACLCVLSALFLLAPARALAAPVLVPLPVDFPAQLVVRDFGIDLEPQCHAIYLDETISTGFYVTNPPGTELADDLHTTLTESQALCGFDFAYYNPGAAPVTATVTLYENDASDAGRGTPIAGPYVIEGLPPGANAFHFEVQGGTVSPHVWLGIAFDDGATGLLTFSPATLGSSHDTAWISPPDQAVSFGGQPPANFFLGLYSSPSTAAQSSTWGSLKALYR